MTAMRLTLTDEPTLEYARTVGCPRCGDPWNEVEKLVIDLGHITVFRDFLRCEVWWVCPEGEFHRCTDLQAAQTGRQP